ncbi:hypothetical protein Bcep1808_4617 [Burkholderia vietnamiensis G4]|uniref:Uncharacterized protein n=1 Tax=Burkholderia vietnamiensis (strain G4 / LMG 22486) TaxID=269482 RepID=A4JMS5_BURVG|nr:hypothetical protein Bcep1808_4617 [Burkholderia vietnamiensis G4]
MRASSRRAPNRSFYKRVPRIARSRITRITRIARRAQRSHRRRDRAHLAVRARALRHPCAAALADSNHSSIQALRPARCSARRHRIASR